MSENNAAYVERKTERFLKECSVHVKLKEPHSLRCITLLSIGFKSHLHLSSLRESPNEPGLFHIKSTQKDAIFYLTSSEFLSELLGS